MYNSPLFLYICIYLYIHTYIGLREGEKKGKPDFYNVENTFVCSLSFSLGPFMSSRQPVFPSRVLFVLLCCYRTPVAGTDCWTVTSDVTDISPSRSKSISTIQLSVRSSDTVFYSGSVVLFVHVCIQRFLLPSPFLDMDTAPADPDMEEDLVVVDDSDMDNRADDMDRTKSKSSSSLTALPMPTTDAASCQPSEPKGKTPYTTTVHLKRGPKGYGFSVTWTHPPRYSSHATSRSVSARASLPSPHFTDRWQPQTKN